MIKMVLLPFCNSKLQVRIAVASGSDREFRIRPCGAATGITGQKLECVVALDYFIIFAPVLIVQSELYGETFFRRVGHCGEALVFSGICYAYLDYIGIPFLERC